LIPAALMEALRQRHWRAAAPLSHLGACRGAARPLSPLGAVPQPAGAPFCGRFIGTMRSTIRRRKDNEELSAQLLEQEAAEPPLSPRHRASPLRSSAPRRPTRCRRACQRRMPETSPCSWTSTCRSSARPKPVYDQYEQDIRAEYAFVPADAYRAGRGAILKGFLSRPRLYFTDIAHAEWDAAARANLARALRALEQG
jgi:hypothetical protein